MSTELVLAVLGILLTIYFGVLGVRAVMKHRQKQVVKGGSTAIQSGRDTKIGGSRLPVIRSESRAVGTRPLIRDCHQLTSGKSSKRLLPNCLRMPPLHGR
jgi:hypothetical protein